MVICKYCLEDKDEKDFYMHSNGKRKFFWKIWFRRKESELWTCPSCLITIRKISKIKHENSIVHQKCKLLNETYYKTLPIQNIRRSEKLLLFSIKND